jgi:hypothetical protein
LSWNSPDRWGNVKDFSKEQALPVREILQFNVKARGALRFIAWGSIAEPGRKSSTLTFPGPDNNGHPIKNSNDKIKMTEKKCEILFLSMYNSFMDDIKVYPGRLHCQLIYTML